MRGSGARGVLVYQARSQWLTSSGAGLVPRRRWRGLAASQRSAASKALARHRPDRRPWPRHFQQGLVARAGDAERLVPCDGLARARFRAACRRTRRAARRCRIRPDAGHRHHAAGQWREDRAADGRNEPGRALVVGARAATDRAVRQARPRRFDAAAAGAVGGDLCRCGAGRGADRWSGAARDHARHQRGDHAWPAARRRRASDRAGGAARVARPQDCRGTRWRRLAARTDPDRGRFDAAAPARTGR